MATIMVRPTGFRWGCCSMFILLFVSSVLFDASIAVDKSKFRTCQQGSFCRRYRQYISKIGSSDFVHEVDPSSVSVSKNAVHAKIKQVHDAAVKPLNLGLRFYKDSVDGNCGIVRMQVDEDQPLHPRFRLQEGDVVMKDLEGETVSHSTGGGETRITSSAPGGCEVVLKYRPFEVHFSAGGRKLQVINGRHLMNYERYRKKGAHHAGLVDATDVNQDALWEENFGEHTDKKPLGPAAVGIDVTFESATVMVGLAEHATDLHLNENHFPEPYRLFNLDVFEYAMDVPMALYGAVPFVTAIHRPQGDLPASASGFFFVNPSEGFVQLGVSPSEASSSSETSWWLFESGVLDLFLFAGPNPEAVLTQYHTVTGWGRLPPISTLGKHQCRWNYVDVADSIGVNKGFDKHDIPFDVLWLDIEHTDGKKYFTWHPSHFGQPDELLDALEADKRKLVTIVDPHIKKEKTYDVYKKLEAMNFMTKTINGKEYEGWCWPGNSAYPDFCNPAMRDQWAKFFALDYYPHNRVDLYTWNDMNEPSVFNGPEITMPRDNLHKCSGDAYNIEHRDLHNVYGFYHHMATVQGHLHRAPNVRPFVLTRSFFAGSHRHGAIWTGDNMARWPHLSKSVPMLVSLCMSGISFVGADVPGFFYDAEPELYRRWHQLGIWYPFYRGHAHLETKRREPWLLGDAITAMVREQVTVRYQMLPMWYTLFAEWAGAGKPVLRPLWYHSLEDEEAYRHSNDHYLVGEHILVRAITEADAKTKSAISVYLPPGRWFDFWRLQAEPIPGGKSIEVLPDKDHVPVYVRGGSILFKKMRRRRSAGTMVNDPYTLYCLGPEASGRIYIDDGESHDFQQGAFLYEAFKFDGKRLQSSSEPLSLPAFGPSRALPNFPERSLRIERIVFHGLPQRPTRAALSGSEVDTAGLHLTTEAEDGATFSATIKKPSGLIGGSWQIELSYA